MAGVDALALLAAIVVAVSVAGILVAWVLDPSSARSYRFAAASPRRRARPAAHEEIRDAA